MHGLRFAAAAGVKKLCLVGFAVTLAAGRAAAQGGVFFMTLPPEVLPVDVGGNAFTMELEKVEAPR